MDNQPSVGASNCVASPSRKGAWTKAQRQLVTVSFLWCCHMYLWLKNKQTNKQTNKKTKNKKLRFEENPIPSTSNQQNAVISRWFLLQQSLESSCTRIASSPGFVGWESKGLTFCLIISAYPPPSHGTPLIFYSAPFVTWRPNDLFHNGPWWPASLSFPSWKARPM